MSQSNVWIVTLRRDVKDIPCKSHRMQVGMTADSLGRLIRCLTCILLAPQRNGDTP